MKNFADRLIEAILAKKSYLCIGLDPQLRYFPPHLLKYCIEDGKLNYEAAGEAIFLHNLAIINATVEFAPCFKPQMAFYEKYGSYGVLAFEKTVRYIKSIGELVLEDAKREDGGDTALAYAEGHLGFVDIINPNYSIANEFLIKTNSPFDVDAMTITNWIGEPNLAPYMNEIKDGKGIFVVVKTSFKPASPFQEMLDVNGEKGWEKMAKEIEIISEKFIGENGYSSIGVVCGSTYPEESEKMRKLVPRAFQLRPGFGVQGAGADEAIIGINEDGFGILPNNSRGTNYAWNPKFKSEFQCDSKYFANAASREAQKARDLLNKAVKKRIGFLPWQTGAVKVVDQWKGEFNTSLSNLEKIKFGAFKLKLHETNPDAPLSPIYLNIRGLPARLYKLAGKLLRDLYYREGIKDFDYVIGIPKAGQPIGQELAEILNKPLLKIEKVEGESGRRITSNILDPFEKDRKVLLVDDLITKADTKREAIKSIEENGLKVVATLVLYDREQGGLVELNAEGKEVRAVFKLSETLDFFVGEHKIPREKAEEVMKYISEN